MEYLIYLNKYCQKTEYEKRRQIFIHDWDEDPGTYEELHREYLNYCKKYENWWEWWKGRKWW